MPTYTLTMSGTGATFSADSGSAASRTATSIDTVPELFLTATAAKLNVGVNNNMETNNDGSNDDTIGLSVRIMSGATVLAAADAGGTNEQVDGPKIAANGNNQFTNVEVPFTYVNLTATRAQWQSASVVWDQSYNSNMANDSGWYWVLWNFAGKDTTFEITFDASAATLSLPTETPGITVATVGCTTNVDSGTFYAFVSTSATAPDAATLKAGTGAVWSGNITPTDFTPSITAPYGTFTPATTYYTYMIQNSTGGDSNILESGSWQTLEGDLTLACSTEHVRMDMPLATVTKQVFMKIDYTGAASGNVLIAFLASDKTSGEFTAQGTGWTRRISSTELRDAPDVHFELWTKVSDGTETVESWTGLNNTALAYGEILVGHDLTNAQFFVEDPAGSQAQIQLAPIGILPDSAADTVFVGMTVALNQIIDFDIGGEFPTYGFSEMYNVYNSEFSHGMSIYKDELIAYGGTNFVAETPSIWGSGAHAGFGPYDDLVSVAGYDTSTLAYTAKVQSYNGSTWSTETIFPRILHYHTAAGASSTSGIVMTGDDDTTPGTYSALSTSYNGTAWTAENNVPIGCNRGGGVGTETAALHTGGSISGAEENHTFEFDGTSWSSTGVFQPSGLKGMGITGSQSAAFITGGYNRINGSNGNYWAYSQVYNGSTWSYEATMVGKRAYHWMSGSDTDAMVGGGGSASDSLPRYLNYGYGVESYNGTAWSDTPGTNSPGPHTADTLSGGPYGATPFYFGTSYQLTTQGYLARQMFVWRTMVEGDYIRPFYKLTSSSEYPINFAVTIPKTIGEISGFTEHVAVTANQATITIVLHTVIEIPPAENMTLEYNYVKFKKKPYKIHQRQVKPKWDRLVILGFEPTFDNTQASLNRTIVTTTEAVEATGTQATILKTRTIACTTASAQMDATSTVDLGRDVVGATEVVYADGQNAAILSGRSVVCTTGQALATGAGVVDRGRDVLTTTEVVHAESTAAVDRGLDVLATTEAVEAAGSTATILTDRNVVCLTGSVQADATASVDTGRDVLGATEAIEVESTASVNRGRDAVSTTEAVEATGTTANLIFDRLVVCTTAGVEAESTATVDQGRDVLSITEAVEAAGTNATIIIGNNNFTVVCTTANAQSTTTAATVDQGRDVLGATEAVEATTTTANLIFDRLVQSATESVQADAAASVDLSRDILGTTEFVEVSGLSTIDLGRNALTATEVVHATGTTATILADRLVVCTTASTQMVATASVLLTRSVVATTGTALMDASSTVSRDRNVQATTEFAEARGVIANVGQGLTVQTMLEVVHMDALPATILRDRFVQCGTAQAEATGNSALLGFGQSIICQTAQVEAAGSTATIGRGRSVVAQTARAEITGTNAQVLADRLVTGTTEQVQVQSTATVIRGRFVSAQSALAEVTVGSAVVNRARIVGGQAANVEINTTDANIGRGRAVQCIPAQVYADGLDAVVTTGIFGVIICETTHVQVNAGLAAIRWMTITNPLPDYRNIGVVVQERDNDPGAPVLVVSNEEVVSLTGASVVDTGESSGLL